MVMPKSAIKSSTSKLNRQHSSSSANILPPPPPTTSTSAASTASSNGGAAGNNHRPTTSMRPTMWRADSFRSNDAGAIGSSRGSGSGGVPDLFDVVNYSVSKKLSSSSHLADIMSMSSSSKGRKDPMSGSVASLGADVAGGGGGGGKVEPSSSSSVSSTTNRIKTLLVKYKKLKKSDISSPLNFNHVTHLDKPVPIGKRYKFDYC